MSIDRKQIEAIVEKVLEGISASNEGSSQSPVSGITDGVFGDIEDAIQAAVVAHEQLVRLPLAVREKVIEAL